MFLQSWQIVAIIVVAFVFGLGLGRTFGEGRAWKQEAARFAREGFTADEQAAIAERMTMEEDMARRFAHRLMEESRPYPVLDIPYAEDDEPLHTDESPFCSDVSCPCHCGHVLNGRIVVESL